jgi:hypothetical protein
MDNIRAITRVAHMLVVDGKDWLNPTDAEDASIWVSLYISGVHQQMFGLKV